MAIIEQLRNGDGSTLTGFTFTFPSYQVEDIKVAWLANDVWTDKTVTTHYTIVNYTPAGGGEVQFTSGNAPPNAVGNVRIYRDTDVDTVKASYQAGSSITADDLNNNFKSGLYALQELKQEKIDTNQIWDGAVTSDKIKDDTIVNADINSAAEIAVSKLADGAARQVLQTAADGSAVEWTSNVDLPGTLDVTGATTLDGTLAAGATTVTGNITVSGTVDGRDVAADGTKLDTIETNATADQTNAEIRTAVEAASDSNVFTDADHSKLNGIEATADVTDAANVNAAGAVMNTDTTTADMQFVVDEDNFSSNLATKVPTQQSTKAYIEATSQPVNANLTTLAGMESGTASVLASSTALTSTTAELNLLDGKSIVTTISSPTDVQIPTAQAVDERIIDLVTDVGGFRPIANETSFPATNPDPEDNAGTIVSVKALASNLTSNGSGVATIANGAGSGNTVTITGMANNDTIEAGIGILVETTSTLHTYTFHRETLASADITTANTAVSDFNNRYRILASGTNINTVGSLDDGDLLWDSNVDKMKVYDATASAWKEVTSTGDFKFLVPVNPGTTTAADWGNTGLSNGNSGTSWDLKEGTNSGSTASVTSVHQLLVSVNGVIQKSNTGSWSGSGEGFYLQDSDTIRFATAPAAGSSVFIIQIGSAISIPTPGDNTVSTVKIQNLAVDHTKIADDTITEAKLDVSNNPTNGQFLQAQSGEGGGLTWATVSASDSTKMPLAGGTFTGDVIFDGDSANITFDKSEDDLIFDDNAQARFGAGADLFLYSNGSSGFVGCQHSGGSLNLGTTSSNAQMTLNSSGVRIADDLTMDNGTTAALSTGSMITIEPHSSNDTDGIRFKERNANGSAYIGLKGVLDKGSDASYTITLPSAAPTANGQALTATTGGVASWTTISSGVTSTNTTNNTTGGTNAGAALDADTTDNTLFGYDTGKAIDSGDDNSAFGGKSLQATTSGGANTAVGYYSLYTNVSGSNCVAVGADALRNNTYSGNTAVGKGSLYTNSSGYSNVAVGMHSLYTNNGNNNTGIGYYAMEDITSASQCTAVGAYAMDALEDGNYNEAFGYGALGSATTAGECSAFGSNAALNTTTGIRNVAVGHAAMLTNTTGQYNTVVGYKALYENNGNYNTVVGHNAAYYMDTGGDNVAIGHEALRCASGQAAHPDSCVAVGYQALKMLVDGSNNVGIGVYAGQQLSTAGSNVAVGFDALRYGTTSDANTCLGKDSGKNLTTGNNNTTAGVGAGLGLTTGGNNICIGNHAGTSGSPSGNITTGSNNVVLGDNSISNFYCADTSISSSDKRDKTDVVNFTEGLSWINKLNPVTYRWDKRAWYDNNTPDGSKKRNKKHIGFLAQDVLAVEGNPNKDDMLVVNLNEDDTAYGLKYERLVPVLVNAIKELSTKVTELEAKLSGS